MRAIGREPLPQPAIVAEDAYFSLMESYLVKALILASGSEARESNLAPLISSGLMYGSATSSKAGLKQLRQDLLARVSSWMFSNRHRQIMTSSLHPRWKHSDQSSSSHCQLAYLDYSEKMRRTKHATAQTVNRIWRRLIRLSPLIL